MKSKLAVCLVVLLLPRGVAADEGSLESESVQAAGGRLEFDDKGRVISVDLSFQDVSAVTMSEVCKLAHMESLNLNYATVEGGAGCVSGLRSLVELRLCCGRKGVAGGIVVGLDNLRLLSVGDSDFAWTGLGNHEGLASLRWVSAGSTRLGKEGVAWLGQCKSLERVELEETDIVDEQLAILAQLGGLRVLDVSGTGIGDKGVEILAQLRGMTELYLRGTRITDEGLAKLDGSFGLLVLDLRDTACSAARVKAFTERHVGTTVLTTTHE